MTDDEKRIEERVRLYAEALHQRVMTRVLVEAKLKGLDWIGPLWVESAYARILENIRNED